jgi:hypothetical protein
VDQLPGLNSDYSYDSLLTASDQYAREVLETGLRIRGGDFRRLNAPEPLHNVVGVAVGEKITENARTSIASVVLFVRRKYRVEEIPFANRLPSDLDGIPVDVIETGEFVALGCDSVTAIDPKHMKRPAVPGYSIGGVRGHGGTGTFGALVTQGGGSLFILSNHHVLADPDSVALDGDVFQPGKDDRNDKVDTRIGKVAKIVPLLPPPGVNVVDAAIAGVLASTDVGKEILGIGAPTGTRAAVFGDLVRKFGRSTRCRIGRVDQTPSAHVAVTIPHANLTEFLFRDQIVIRTEDPTGSFSAKGDSGSLILDADTTDAVGLLFAGNVHPANPGPIQGVYSLANRIDVVLRELGVIFA